MCFKCEFNIQLFEVFKFVITGTYNQVSIADNVILALAYVIA